MSRDASPEPVLVIPAPKALDAPVPSGRLAVLSIPGARAKAGRPSRHAAAAVAYDNVVTALARIAMPLAVTTILAGCALATDTPPTVGVLNVHLVSIGLTEQQLAMTLCVVNPNANQIAFRRVTVALDVSGAPLATGTSDLPVQLPPQSATTVPFTVLTTVENLGPQLLGVFRTGSLDYRVHGTVSLQGGFGLTLPFSRSGRLDVLAGGLELVTAATDPSPSRCSATATALRPT